MDDKKFLDDADVKSLFADNEAGESSETGDQPPSNENVLEIPSEELKVIFSDNDDTENNETEPAQEEQKQPDNSNVNFSDIAKQLGFDEDVNDIESLKSLIEDRITNGISEDTRRVKEALENGVDAKDISEYEETLKYLHSITKDILIDESEESDNVRRRLILQDLLNRGVDEKEAVSEVKKIFKEGRDIEEAEKALAANKKYFRKEYDDLLDEAKRKSDEYNSSIEKQTADIKDAIFNKGFMDLDLDDKTKNIAMKNISDPMYKDPDTGESLTAIQKYQRENPVDFLKNLAMMFTLTDGFKNMNKIIDPLVKKKMNKQIEDVEDVLKNPSKANSNLKMVTNESSSSANRFKFAI